MSLINREELLIFIFCSDCQVQTKPYYSEKKAIEDWNRRLKDIKRIVEE